MLTSKIQKRDYFPVVDSYDSVVDLINVTIITAEDVTYAVAKRKPEKNQACQDSNPDFCDPGAAPLNN